MSRASEGRSELVVRRLAAGAVSLIGLCAVGVVVFIFVGTATTSENGLFSRGQVLQLEASLTGSLILAACSVAAFRVLWRSDGRASRPRTGSADEARRTAAGEHRNER
jgi:membrane protein implicated in regulation of membrane protease activity